MVQYTYVLVLASFLQRVHSARVYTQALELYRGKGWALAEVVHTAALHSVIPHIVPLIPSLVQTVVHILCICNALLSSHVGLPSFIPIRVSTVCRTMFTSVWPVTVLPSRDSEMLAWPLNISWVTTVYNLHSNSYSTSGSTSTYTRCGACVCACVRVCVCIIEQWNPLMTPLN